MEPKPETCTPVQDEGQTVPLDMSEVTRRALALQLYRIEFDCDGRPYRWAGWARDVVDAEGQAAAALRFQDPLFRADIAKVVGVVKGEGAAS